MAMWLRTSEYEDWRFALSSRDLDGSAPLASIRLVHKALDRGNLAFEDTPAFLIFKTTEPFVRALRRIFGKVKSVEGRHVSGQPVGDRFVDEAIIYRIG